MCYGAGSPNKGQPTEPTDTCEAHTPAGCGRGLPLQVVAVEGMPQDRAVLIGSISVCPGDDMPCPTCLGIELLATQCTTCGRTGRVGLAKEQTGIVVATNLGAN